MRAACGSWRGEGDGGLFPEVGRTLDFPLLSAPDCSTALSNSGGLEGCVAERTRGPQLSSAEKPGLWSAKTACFPR